MNQPYFDATPFTGIAFDMNIPAYTVTGSGASAVTTGDNNTARVLQIAIDLTEPVTAGFGGKCVGSGCFNHFQVPLQTGTTNGWMHQSYNWSSFNPAFGSVTPAGLSNHLTKFIFLQWQFGDNQDGGGTTSIVSHTDLWVDNVRFLP